jgi:serine/threonine protein kinase
LRAKNAPNPSTADEKSLDATTRRMLRDARGRAGRRRVITPIPFGRYRLVERIGAGGMATVYRAMIAGPAGFERDVVVKMMLPELADNPEFVTMFMNEAKLAARLHHPNIAQVQELGFESDNVFIAMEYIDGVDLSQLLTELTTRGERVPLATACFMVREICDALAYAHAIIDTEGRPINIVHRDISPSNIMLGRDGSVKLLDFGIAKLLEDKGAEESTRVGTLKGKYSYMAPEQALGRPIDHRVDIFATGVVLHELLTGKRLFKAASDFETLRNVAAAHVSAPSASNPEVTPELDTIVLRALAREADERYQTAQEMGEALDELGNAFRMTRPRFAALLRRYYPNRLAPPARSGERTLPASTSSATHRDYAEIEIDLDAGDRRQRRWLLAGLFLSLALSVAALLVWLQRGTPAESRPAVPTPAAALATAETEPTAATEPTAGEVAITIDTSPSGAEVRRAADGATLGETPLVWRTRRARGPVTLELVHPGYKTAHVETALDRDARVYAALQIEAPPPPVRPAPVRTRHKATRKSIDLKSGGLVDPFGDR